MARLSIRIFALLPLLLLLFLSAANPCRAQKFGIDVSHHQGNIKWDKVPKNVLFVYIKATEGSTWVDPKYKTNIKEARKAGFKVGAYHFFRMTSSAHAQFENFKKVAKKSDQDLLPIIDVETSDGWSMRAVRDSLRVLIRLMKDHYGKAPMIYCMSNDYKDYCGESFNNYHLYLSRFSDSIPVIPGKGHYSIWQYTDKGSVAGIPKDVDKAKFHPDYSVKDIEL